MAAGEYALRPRVIGFALGEAFALISSQFIKRSIVGAITMGGATFLNPEYSYTTVLLPSGLSLKLGERTSQPIGHHEFCNSHANECTGEFGEVARVKLTNTLWQYIVDIDSKFNAKITAMNDPLQWGKNEVWSFADTSYGDCEDYALEKRRALSDRIHPANLLLTVVRKRDGEWHAVLTVRTDRGDFFLDNLKAPMPVDQSDYQIIKAVDPRNEGLWVRVKGQENIFHEMTDTAATDSLKPGFF